MKSGNMFSIEVVPAIPRKLSRLEELAGNLWYSWDRPTRSLFAQLHPKLWSVVGHNPKVFLRRVDEQRLQDAAENPAFLIQYHRVLASYDSYQNAPPMLEGQEPYPKGELIAYFCAEFGLHESFPIYSGGLGILAGDHCKAASDLNLPFVAVGFLYRQGYFTQQIDADGNQVVHYVAADFDDLPVVPAMTPDGREAQVSVELPGREVHAKVWQARVGHISLYLLDTDLEINSEADRNITYQLYGGDRHMRIQQEILLGVGGARALEAVGQTPTVWHINEGHAAFLVLERIRKLVAEGLDFAAALEAVAANTVFTTHTPVPAGHDHFDYEMVMEYFNHFWPQLNVDAERFFDLGRDPDNHHVFNMTSLAVRGSRYQNGVSRIHGQVSSGICRKLWPQIDPEDNPMDYITNGVHVPTFLALEWAELFDRHLGGEWRNHLHDPEFWERIDDIPDQQFWSVRLSLKMQLLYSICHRLSAQHARNHGSEAHLDRLLKYCDTDNPNVLTIGFARRFATYKRANLLFQNLDWLREITSGKERPVLFIFAGKAHPADAPGHDLIREVHRVANMPEFEGKVLLVEGYDLGLARRLVAGADVWLNTPVYPMEASGTSGMKAGINGTLNLSVLDGWWGEGYDGSNGWAIKPAPDHFDDAAKYREDARTLYEILQDRVMPAFYSQNKMGYSPQWVRMAKRSMATIIPRFSATRQVREYVSKFYLPAGRQGARYADKGFVAAKTLAAWKAHVLEHWSGVSMRQVEMPPKRIGFGRTVRIEVAVHLGGLKAEDIRVELLLARTSQIKTSTNPVPFLFECKQVLDNEHLFVLEMQPELCGKLSYLIRAYPYHELLTHPHEMGLMAWL
ncbi:glycogen phosphorylase [Novimethylophilus kurashikiensis]|uniref:Glycogen phosphorylase n=1 Tax=Novimethylophilus kurashikiensis TaxID=1825523 RepID=A0A2R5F4N9_9PROT|nr:alpha-glucan family phosphorylase [Novimethylophilus kurashikiensis]GBG12959.1 glycogen phosphorylase [Novimethylophilus kurashikiensis]